jgi:DNA-binding MarR family transcriptional regulator
LNVSALAEHVDATPAQLARLLAPLVDAGLVTVASRDGSPLIARPTGAGHAAIDRLVSARRAGLTALLGSWSAELDSQLSRRIAELAVDLLRDPSRREELLGVVK